MISQDEDHLRLLSIFHYVCAGLAALFACFPVIHLAMGIFLIARSHGINHSSDPKPVLVGLLFVCVALAFIVFGWLFALLLAWAGRCLSQRKHYNFCLVMAAVACLFMPFGTVLGVFTILVLVRPSVKALFGLTPQPPVMA